MAASSATKEDLKGQAAMALAMIYPDTQHGRHSGADGAKQSDTEPTPMLSATKIGP